MSAARLSAHPTKHQIKTEATRGALLEAAETVFVRDGYERARIETIAAEAGRTKGAVYAHFESKEDIFFALLEKRIKNRRGAILKSLQDSPLQHRTDVIREAFVRSFEDERWHILMLEFKLFAMRNKASVHRMRALYRLLYDSVAHPFLSQAKRLTDIQMERMMIAVALLRGIPGAVILERQFCPGLNSPGATHVLGAIFDFLLDPPNPARRRKGSPS
jgi:AcrR family transcriptional regulator